MAIFCLFDLEMNLTLTLSYLDIVELLGEDICNMLDLISDIFN